MSRFAQRAIFPRARVGFLSDPGVVRAENQDSVFVPDPSQVDAAKGLLVAVADGMGGAAGGALASSTAVSELQAYYTGGTVGGMNDLAVLFRVEAANARLQELVRAKPQLKGMGTTLTAVLISDSALDLFHVGDSRAFLFRSGELKQLTKDHTLLAKWTQQGTLLKNPRNLGKSVLTRALGVQPQVEVDRETVPVQEGDRLMLCSDGLHGVVAHDRLTEAMGKWKAPWEATRVLVDLACEAGGPDNVSVIVVDFGGGPAQQ